MGRVGLWVGLRVGQGVNLITLRERCSNCLNHIVLINERLSEQLNTFLKKIFPVDV